MNGYMLRKGGEKVDRREIIFEAEKLMADYCDGCFLYKYHKKEKGRRYAHRFCISKCTIGEKIKLIGKKLT